jgi:hypothetical protein
MIFLIPIIAIIILVWAIDAIYFSEVPTVKAAKPVQESAGNTTAKPQNYLDAYIKK